jgi:hypothetical protein
VPDTCATYHNGTIACGKPNDQLRTTLPCGVWLSQHPILQTDRGRIHNMLESKDFQGEVRRGTYRCSTAIATAIVGSACRWTPD